MARVLVVDDSVLMRNNLKTMLTAAGHDVVAEAADGDEAVAAYRRCQPDLVTMDITMPVMNGHKAIKTIIADDPQARIIVISAQGTKHSVLEAVRNGAVNFILKPISMDKVLDTIEQALGITRTET